MSCVLIGWKTLLQRVQQSIGADHLNAFPFIEHSCMHFIQFVQALSYRYNPIV